MNTEKQSDTLNSVPVGFLFDLDGVLIDSENEYTRIWGEVEKVYPTGIPDFPLVIKGQTLHKILTDNYPDADTQQKVSQLLHRLESRMVYNYCPGAEEFLKKLKARNVPVAIVTSSDDVKMGHLYQNIPNFLKLVDKVIDAKCVTKSKPDPEGYQLGAKALKVPVEHCVVFEDSMQGVKAGKASRAYVVGITGTKTREELSPYSDNVIDNLSEIDVENLIKILQQR